MNVFIKISYCVFKILILKMKKILALLTCAAGALKVDEQFGRPSTSFLSMSFLWKNIWAPHIISITH